MALTIGQIAAVSYPAVLNEMRKPDNQWAESALLREMERQDMIVKKDFGASLQEVLDYRRNPGAGFLAYDMAPTALTKTEVLTAADYAIGEISVPVVWSKKDEVQNPTQSQKVDLVQSLLTNGINSHDDLIEEALFAAAATNGFLSLNVLVPTTGQGTVGGIDASVEVFWRNQANTYLADGSDIDAAFTRVYNLASKGSGSAIVPTLMASGSATHALFEASQTPMQRYIDTQDIKAGAKTLGFKTCRYIFSLYGGTKVYFLGPKAFGLRVSRQYFRDKGETQEIDNANGFSFKIYSALQSVTMNKSRLAVSEAA